MTRFELSTPLADVVSPYVGIVRAASEITAVPGFPPLVNVTVTPALTHPATGATINPRAGACGFTRTQAHHAAVGEALERYSASYVPGEAVVTGSARDLGGLAVDVERLRLYRRDQLRLPGFPYANPNHDDILGWCVGRRLSDGAPLAMPAQQVYLGYHLQPDEPLLATFTSSGLACHPDQARATLSAAFESLERDAFCCVWWLQLSLPLIDWQHDPALGDIRMLMRRARPSIRLDLIDASQIAHVPTVIALMRDRGHPPIGLVVGAAAGATGHLAVRSAFREVCQTYALGRLIAREEAGLGERADAFDEHVSLWVAETDDAASAFLTASPTRTCVSEMPSVGGGSAERQLANLTEHLSSVDIELVRFDVTSPDLAALGLNVVRVLGPDLCWLDVDPDAPFLGRPRLTQQARRWGTRSAWGSAILNPRPHPFP